MRESVFVWLANWATKQANKYADPFHGSSEPYWFLVPVRETYDDCAPVGEDAIGA